ncbi:MAG: hypothetical protein DDT20_00365 [Firmicutes bacterium]|uniref:Uncharacterized protein n=1 Tax=Candidatus Hakubella thermalkaliphila TaxID=2754717 RepID=A0A6V8Q8W4_9ACTN|nr:hypothetical protein [Candidatus Hakubella thermalkaliphila]MBT9176063.1 hypothetical protein [Bacillota bacterium]GFP26724.1 hypothetical protein HKBW3S33_00139 [Candidatus Hakubella thermalkaliphila]GFP35351.1 hypothetical protein HKBW3S43_01143 [Candidatus Hakubella thermalkaliphila]GFP40983.1 hypothetical protein HKBW3C_00108 [Candidatus Hakubella thermalkaliphila]
MDSAGTSTSKDDLRAQNRQEQGPQAEWEDSRDKTQEEERWAVRLREAELIATLLKRTIPSIRRFRERRSGGRV